MGAPPNEQFRREVWPDPYQRAGEMSAGLSGLTFRVGLDRVADAVTLENLNTHRSSTLTRVPAGEWTEGGNDE